MRAVIRHRRRSFLSRAVAALFVLPFALSCAQAPQSGPPKTAVYVMGVIHSGHLTSETYSLPILKEAIRKAAPHVVITEIPPDRIDQAISSFADTGVVNEPRTQVFPEYTEVVFPLSKEIAFDIVGGAGWTRQLARERGEALQRIRNDPARAKQWAEHRAAVQRFSTQLAGRGDDPHFVHTDEFDALARASRGPYEQHFDTDLGAGGWTQINRAHTDLINKQLDAISGKGLTAVITFGTLHKYKILESLEQRDDVDLLDTRTLFD